jgi:hypothetical protein
MWAPPGESKQIIPEGNLTPNQNNEPPALAAIPNLLVAPGHSLTFSASATDADTPAQSLTFSLDPGAPAGASINRTNGLFTWTPPPTQPLGTYRVTVRVTDNGAPGMTDAQTVNINLGTDFTFQPALTITRSGSNVALSWPIEAGSFQLYTTANLSPSSTWTHLSSTPAVSNGQGVVWLPVSTNPARFFRLQTQ